MDRKNEIVTAMMDARYTRQAFEKKAFEVAARLRKIADEIERDITSGMKRLEAPEYPATAVELAVAATNAVQWGIANADLPGLVTRGAQLDRAIANRRQLEITDTERADVVSEYGKYVEE